MSTLESQSHCLPSRLNDKGEYSHILPLSLYPHGMNRKKHCIQSKRQRPMCNVTPTTCFDSVSRKGPRANENVFSFANLYRQVANIYNNTISFQTSKSINKTIPHHHILEISLYHVRPWSMHSACFTVVCEFWGIFISFGIPNSTVFLLATSVFVTDFELKFT